MSFENNPARLPASSHGANGCPNQSLMDRCRLLRMAAACLCLIAAAAPPLQAQWQSQSGFRLFTWSPGPGKNILGALSSDMQSRLHGEQPLGPVTTLLFDGQISNLFNVRVPAYQTIPATYSLSSGLRFAGPGELHARAGTAITPDALWLSPPWLPAGSRMHTRQLNSIDAGWRLDHSFLGGEINSTWFSQSYLLEQPSPDAPGAPSTENLHRESDLWIRSTIAGRLPQAGLELTLHSTIKNDLNEYDGYDLYDHQLILQGTHTLAQKKLLLAWSLSERYVRNAVWQSRGYEDGFSTQARIVPIIKLKNTLFLKGDARIAAGRSTLLQRYAVALRTVRKKSGSSLDLGYQFTAGTLFPRQHAFIQPSFNLSPKMSLQPAASLHFFADAAGINYHYGRTDAGLGVVIKPWQRAELTAGGRWSHYAGHLPVPSNTELSVTLSTW